MRRNEFPFRSFWGNDNDYGGYNHKYDEKDTDRGAGDEVYSKEERKRWSKQ